ncbi:zinc finger protein 526 isoform X2 [Hippocampus zosterae]|uniref:zinc finger protein 526 isoform X2 n=1 Tax=Hippocampus zosterae TaxID=109293 RepID=UPI00223DB5C0|nr:zinc finger protein 526 isoform X2 [Hippocampus zosterae]
MCHIDRMCQYFHFGTTFLRNVRGAPVMSDLDTLVVTFQTQLLDLMETVVKTTMYKVTQLVENCFLDEVKRKSQELETLRIRLECAEVKLKNRCVKEGKKDGTFVEITSDADDNTSGERLGELHGDVLMSCPGKNESDTRWTDSPICDIESEADEPLAILTPEEGTHKIEHADVMPSVNVKEEVNEGGSDSDSASVRIHAYPGDSQETSKGLESSDMTTHLSVEMHTGWTGLTLHRHRVRPDWKCHPAKSNCSLQQAKEELVDSAIEADRRHVNTSRDQLSSSESSSMQNPNSPSVPIKQEDFDGGGADSGHLSNKASTKAGIASFSCAETKKPIQEEIKLHSTFDSTCDRLQASVKQVSRALKKPPGIPSGSTAALSQIHSQTFNVDSLNKIPSTSKAAPPTALSVQRDHLANKLPATLWVNNRAWPPSANSHHGYLTSHPDSHPVFRHSLRCGQCGKCFPHPSNLKAHLQTHTGERPFCCSLCGRSFTKLSNLKAHRTVHTGERPYCCLACGKRFTQKCNLKRHQRIHVDV